MNITNIIDVLIVLAIVWFGVMGFKRGVFKQLVSTIGFVIVVILAFKLKNPLAEFLSLHLPFFDFSGVYSGVTSLNILLYQLISFVILIIILQSILGIVIRLTGIVEKILKFTIILGIPSKILGAVVGLIEGFIIVFIVLFFLKQPAFNISLFDGSKLTPKILNSTPVLSSFSSGVVNTVDDIYNISLKYGKEETVSNELNKEAIDTMLKHKIITPDYVVKLVDKGKIKINGIDTIINKYR